MDKIIKITIFRVDDSRKGIPKGVPKVLLNCRERNAGLEGLGHWNLRKSTGKIGASQKKFQYLNECYVESLNVKLHMHRVTIHKSGQRTTREVKAE